MIPAANRDEDYGGRVFSCRDPEGHLWNIGSYDPWTARKHNGTPAINLTRTGIL
jgi:hypothetical protein